MIKNIKNIMKEIETPKGRNKSLSILFKKDTKKNIGLKKRVIKTPQTKIGLSKRAINRRNLNFQIRERNKLKFKISSNSKKSLHKNSKSRIVNERSTPNLSNSKEIFEVISRLFINNYTTKVLRCLQRKNFVKDLLEQAPKKSGYRRCTTKASVLDNSMYKIPKKTPHNDYGSNNFPQPSTRRDKIKWAARKGTSCSKVRKLLQKKYFNNSQKMKRGQAVFPCTTLTTLQTQSEARLITEGPQFHSLLRSKS
ncbi:unnamed protein product [Moneuplotes crassus]|uniref:Uncharacterized protein n=1 Tax=Euplotes crassus TaxID=5936 RepID=A0AAD2DBL4_EUPCR|nr:unnamed protein product [Moneuplotes crassus]